MKIKNEAREWRVRAPAGSLPAIVRDEQVIAERVYNGHDPLLAVAPDLLGALQEEH